MTNVDENPTATSPVVHNREQNRFELVRRDKLVAHADYRRDGDTLVFFRTYVPESERGQGYAAKVVTAGLEYARDNNLKVNPTCSYVARFIQRNPVYQVLGRT